MAEYIIVNSYASDAERAAVAAINKQGGPEKAELDLRFAAGAAMSSFVAWICVPDWLTALVLGVTLVGGIWTYKAIYKPLQYLKVRHQVSTTDTQLVALDRRWRVRIATMTDKIDAQAEDYQRFTTLRRLAESAGAERSAEIAAVERHLATVIYRGDSD